MQENSHNFSMQEALRLAQSDAGQQLLALLRTANPQLLAEAMGYIAAGDYQKAMAVLKPLMEDPQTRSVMDRLGE